MLMRRFFNSFPSSFASIFYKSLYNKLLWLLAQYLSIRIIMYSIQSIKKPIIECASKKGILMNDCQLIPPCSNPVPILVISRQDV